MTKCCEQNDIFESWKKMLKLHFPVLLAGGIIPIIRSHKWPSYHKKSHGSGYEFSQQPSKGCGWSLPTINSEGAWDIYNKPPKKNILDHLVSQSYSSHLNSKQPRVPREKKITRFVIIADWHPETPRIPSHSQGRIFYNEEFFFGDQLGKAPRWCFSCSRFVLDLLVFCSNHLLNISAVCWVNSLEFYHWRWTNRKQSVWSKHLLKQRKTSLFLSTDASNIKMTVLHVCICWRLTQIRFGENKKHPTGYPQKWRCPSGSDFP